MHYPLTSELSSRDFCTPLFINIIHGSVMDYGAALFQINKLKFDLKIEK